MQNAELVEQNLGLVWYIAKQLYNVATPRESFELNDMFQEGCIGLLKAVKTYKPEKGVKFSTYAGRCIKNEILMHFRKEGRKRTYISVDTPMQVSEENERLTYKDVIKSSSNVESEVLFIDLKKLYINPKNHTRYRKRKATVEEREKSVYELLIMGYKQTEMVQILDSSQRVVASHMANIRKRASDVWLN